MARKKSYDETSVLRSLARRKGVNVNYSSKIIQVWKDATDVGNSTWGKIDYLTHYCGWFVSVVKTLNKKVNVFVDNDDSPKYISKANKRESKLNLVKEVKNNMKRIKR